MALPPQFLDELRARTPMQALVARRVKLSKSGRNWKGCCPFHDEKTPSFYVYEDGISTASAAARMAMRSASGCRASGASFPEAVESLAAEAGLEVPKPSPRRRRAEQQRLDLHGVLDAGAGRVRAAAACARGRGGAGLSARPRADGRDDRAASGSAGAATAAAAWWPSWPRGHRARARVRGRPAA